MTKPLTLGLAVVWALAVGACSTSDPSTSTATATAPSLTPTNESFTGTVPISGNAFNPFTVVLSGGTLTVTMTAAGPPATITMGIGVGTVVGGTCQLLSGGSGQGAASTTPQLSGTINAGAYCVMIFDVGNQTAPVTYAVTVSHY